MMFDNATWDRMDFWVEGRDPIGNLGITSEWLLCCFGADLRQDECAVVSRFRGRRSAKLLTIGLLWSCLTGIQE